RQTRISQRSAEFDGIGRAGSMACPLLRSECQQARAGLRVSSLPQERAALKEIEIMRKFIVGLLGALGVVVLSAGQAGAAPILACPAGEDCNGATVGAELFDLGGTNYRIDVVFDFTGYTGNTTDVL